MRRAALRVLVLLAPLLAGAALATPWTVQTAAFRDDRQAREVVAQLRDLGFDAYREFAMDDGQQFSRVRLGCFASREAADALARGLAGGVTAEAVPVPLSAGAPVRGCVRLEVGFLEPGSWELVERTPGALTFRVVVGGREGWVRLEGDRWLVLQEFAPAPAGASASAGAGRSFGQLSPAGRPLVALLEADGPLALCAGRLLGQTDRAAVVQDGDAVVACSLEGR